MIFVSDQNHSFPELQAWFDPAAPQSSVFIYIKDVNTKVQDDLINESWYAEQGKKCDYFWLVELQTLPQNYKLDFSLEASVEALILVNRHFISFDFPGFSNSFFAETTCWITSINDQISSFLLLETFYLESSPISILAWESPKTEDATNC